MVLAVIPARGGSKGIPRKNVRLMNGKPLIYYAIHNADVYIDAKRGKNGDWSVNVKVSDTYDYTELLLPDAYGKNLQHNLGAVANDAAYVSSKIGAIKPYKIYVNFKTTYNGKKKEVKKDAKK